MLAALGLADAEGRIKPSRQAKYRQVEEFVRILDASITEALGNQLRKPTPDDPLRIVDLGCGNGYLTFAAHRYLTAATRASGAADRHRREAAVGGAQRRHRPRVAIGHCDADFVVGSIDGAILPERDQRPDVVLALHACDTATDEALARAIEWQAPLVLAAPCCHHDVAAQLRAAPTPAPYSSLTRHGILRERFADTLTDALREMLLRLSGYRVDVMQFVESRHTPRNTLLRAVRTGAAADPALQREYDDLVASWQVTPRLAVLLGSDRRGRVSRLEKLLAALAVLPFGLGFAVGAGGPADDDVAFSFADPEIIESSGLAIEDGLFATVNDSGDTGRVFTVDPADGHTVAVTTWDGEPTDVEAMSRASRRRRAGRRHRRQHRLPRVDRAAPGAVRRGRRGRPDDLRAGLRRRTPRRRGAAGAPEVGAGAGRREGVHRPPLRRTREARHGRHQRARAAR